MSDWNTRIIEEFRTNGGQVGGGFEGRPLLLLHHVGAKSGTPRVSPVMYQALDGGFAIFGSKGGAPTNPAWFHNLVATPEVAVEVGTELVEVSARIASDEERGPIWSAWKERFPTFAEYEAKTDRVIPVVILERR